ncbi:hypothetical protein [Streptomyces aurantiogriseus]|uniref:hypothetical protein n=1 Tax=Streptomyces aurantiogriseus TaxID=66870 RepID=UPI001679CF52|nr:hypothetical protein [Streptomyces aurantiogriseus]
MSARQQVSAFLLDIDRYQKQLADFTLDLFVAFPFGEEATLVHQILIDSRNGLRVTLYHSIRIPDPDYAYEPGEFDFTATLAFSESGCDIETLIGASLECAVGAAAPGAYTIHRTRDSRLELDEALNTLGRRVDEMCEIRDAPERIGFVRRS